MKWTDDFLDRKRLETDPIADAIIQKMIEKNGIESSRIIFDKLIRNIDLPTSEFPVDINEFLESTVELPEWLSKEDMIFSNKFFIDHGPKLLLLLYFKSLPLLYSDIKGAQVLVKTSRLTHDNTSMHIFSRRIAETGQFLLNVMANDNFRKNDIAINSIRKVRLIHAAIRHFIAQDWDESSLGKPINQEDMALTLMTFSISLIDGLEKLLVKEDRQMLHAYFERWRAIGVLLGVDPEMIPESIDDGRLLLSKILQRQSGASEAGKLLTKSLVQFSKEAIPGKIFDVAPEALIIYFTGKEISSKLGVSSKIGCFGFGIPAVLASIFGLGEKLEDKSPNIQRLVDKLSIKLIQSMVKYFDEYKNRNFEIPAEFRGFWFDN
jgi:hypothetical protein